jgi:hypothetical protein
MWSAAYKRAERFHEVKARWEAAEQLDEQAIGLDNV